MKDDLTKLNVAFAGGLNLGGGLLPEGQLADASNVVYADGALRSRNGQRLVGIAAPLIYGNTIERNHVTFHDTAGLSLAAYTVGEDWFVCAQFREAGLEVPILNSEGIWKCGMFLFPGGTANPTAGVTAQAAYWNGTGWTNIGHREYDAGSRALRPLTTHMGADAVLICLGVDADHPHGDDSFFDSWMAVEPYLNTRRAFWIRFTITAGTVGAGAVVGTPRGYMPAKPVAMKHFRDSAGRSLLHVYGPTPVPRSTKNSTANGIHTQRFLEFFTDLYTLDPGYAAIPGNPMLPTWPGNGLTINIVRDVAHSHLKSLLWQVRHRRYYLTLVDDETGSPFAGRITPEPEGSVVVAETDRVLVTTPSGLLAASVDSGREFQLSWDAWRLLRRFTFEQFPRGQTTDPVAYDPALWFQMHDIGRPADVEVFDGTPFALYGDGFLRWGAPVLHEGCWNDVAFQVLADEDGRRGVALKAAGGHLVCYCANSIWLVDPASGFIPGLSLVNYVAYKAHGGIGAVGVNAVATTPGGHIFVAPGGVFQYTLTGPPTEVSDSIQALFDRGLSRPALRFASAIYYAQQAQVWISLVRSGSFTNDVVLVFDIASRTWWLHEGIEACLFAYDEEAGVLYSADSWGRIWEQDSGHADGMGAEAGIPWHFETGPIHRGFVSAVYRYLDVAGEHFPGAQYQVALRIRGEEQSQQAFTLDFNIPTHGVATQPWGTAAYSAMEAGGRRKSGVGVQYDSHDVSVIMRSVNPQPGHRLQLHELLMGVKPIGNRAGA